MLNIDLFISGNYYTLFQEDLNMTATSFFTLLDQHIAAKHLLTHPFYKAWTQGELTLECLREYAMQYYHHVKAFPRYLSALHHHTEDARTRKQLLENLIDEEGGSPNHPDLWREFALRLGATELDTDKPEQPISALIEAFTEVCRDGSVAQGLAALYAYESQIPAVSESKIEGLKTHYHLKNPQDWTYFTVHIAADKEHAEVERELLRFHIDENNSALALQAAKRILDRLWDFLTSLCTKYAVACFC